jgi:NAD(P)H dehydrogenase (quinone)
MRLINVLIVYYSMYGHIHRMAEAVVEGASVVDGVEVAMRRVPETLPVEVLEKMGAVDAQETFAHIPICTLDELTSADAIIFGTPTRFWNMCGQMRQFLDATGRLFGDQMHIDEITGWSPYGASTIAGNSGERMPSENELSAAGFQGKYIAIIAS